MRRRSVVQLLIFGLLAAAGGLTLALVPGWLPATASKEKGRIDFVFWFTTIICISIFAVVAAVMTYAIVKFRRRPDDDSDGPPIHGHTGLEIAWTAVPFVLVTAIAVVSAIVLAKNDAAGADPLDVNVTAQQFAWKFTYPESKNLTSGVLRLPVDRSVVLHLKALDVIHSFWVPEFAQKQDTVPGIQTTLHITPTRVGTYPVVCTELCGLGHALMRSQVIVMTQKAFDRWAKGGGKGTAAGGKEQKGQSGNAIFQQQGCGGCHTLKAANATGTTGPSLDELPQEAKRAKQPLEAFVRESIVAPDKYVQPGFPKGVMPQTYGSQLSKAQLDALVQYLVDSSKGSK